MALADRIEDKMPGVVAPTLIVRGERDPLVPERWVRKPRVWRRGRSCASSKDRVTQSTTRRPLPSCARFQSLMAAGSCRYIANFDSASALPRATAGALSGRDFALIDTMPMGVGALVRASPLDQSLA